MLFLLFLLYFSGCEKYKDYSNSNHKSLKDIYNRGKINVITGYNAYSYFIYRGLPMGFEYEIVKRLADDLGIGLEITVVKEIETMFEMLNSGEGDLIAFNLTVTKERNDFLNFTIPITTTKQVLVQRKPENWRRITLDEIEEQLIRNPLDLENKTVHIRKGSSYKKRLENLSEEIGGDINIIEVESDLTLEDLINKVDEGEIEYTVCDENVAKLSKYAYPDLDVHTEISFEQKIAWAVRKSSDILLRYINDWLKNFKKKTEFHVLYNKYYVNRSAYRSRMKSDFLSHSGGKISNWDETIKFCADSLKWDWKLLASMIYQESQFDPDVVSWAGAVGLMQVLPATAKDYDITNLKNPHKNLEAGFKHLLWLQDYWYNKISDPMERIKFILASYNIGVGHIEDSRALAEKYGADPNIWFDNVGDYLLLKSNKKYYNDPLVKNGYARGVETVQYVREIFQRYEHYQQFIL